MQAEGEQKKRAVERRARFKTQEQAFGEERLREEMVAPYKNNLIGVIVVGIGVVGALFNFFPGLLELNEPPSIASFPSEL